MIKRTLGPCKPDVKEIAYNMLVRPIFEYASQIWNSHTTSQIKRLRKVQHCYLSKTTIVAKQSQNT